MRVSFEGTEHAKYFADKKYGGKDRALKFAQKTRDMILEKLPPKKPRRHFQVKTPGSNTGLPRIYFDMRKYSENNISYFYHVRWNERIRQKVPNTRSWGIKKYGALNALILAVRFMDKKMAQLYGEEYLKVRDEYDYARFLANPVLPEQVKDGLPKELLDSGIEAPIAEGKI